jgi:Flp pilus assembly protein TadG
MRNKVLQNEDGQILIWTALALPLLLLFSAFAIDMGMIYVTKAKLSNAVDAAVLTGIRNYNLGTTTAQTLAGDAFQANFGSSAPTLAYTWCPQSPTCSGSTVSLSLTGTATVRTTFMSYLPAFTLWNVSDTATSTRSNLVMSIVLDRSGSMQDDGGGVALQSAVPTFIQNFKQGADDIAMISFSSTATVDVPMTTEFQTPIDNAVAAMNFSGATFGTGAGTASSFNTSYGPPMSMADYQNNSVSFPAGASVTKVVIYFTDGLMNAIQDTFSCSPALANNGFYNYGGHDTGSTVDFIDPTNSDESTNDYSSKYSGNSVSRGTNGCTASGHTDYGTCAGNPPYSSSQRCQGVTQFYSQQNQVSEDFNRSNVTAEAQWRAIYTANAMRGESPVPTYFYVIGLGSDISGSTSTEAFLSTVANDPDGPANYSGAVYNSKLPAGLFLVVPDCPSATCTSELTTAFQTIASKVLLRLSQ